ncbi:helix-turn-helix transcriptional regulator [Brevundimonas sp.]|uniref:helix-turn-helix domain-containing protein n=1 Tax=Brevundimonas sp. TaxID=1871086 RepID=UPI0018167F03|nr:helix-turn-helix transcriptional regulator [Brevundimonas sp.]MBA4808432.1 helix-turn-helix domain-containing protein [Brevundimonas sp.]
MALDAGHAPEEFKAHPDWKDIAPSIAESATLGDGLRRAREQSGKSLAELADETKVHTRFLIALEQNDWSSLPSRVFVIGYVRGYAAALGLDEQLAVERFKRESPDTSAPLKAPIGVAFEDVKRYSPRIIAGVALVALAIVGWNIFQRVNLMRAPQPSDIAAVPESWSLGEVPGQNGLIDLSAPRAAPPDQTTPALYITPGLEAQLTGVDPNDPAVIAAAAAADNAPVQKAFNPRGAVYGAPATASQVVIQAKKPGALVVRLGDGQALFARQMATGEAWRAPLGVSAVIDVSDPTAFDVYLNGEHGGILPAVLTPLAQLNSRAEQAARQVAEEQARRQAQIQADRAAQQAAQSSVTPAYAPPTATN